MTVPERVRLANGLQLVHEHMPALGSVAVELTFTPGPRAEDATTAGLTHFCEHMLFKGTPARDWREISRVGNLHGELNALTTVDFVQLTTRVIAEDLEESLGLLVEMASDSTFPAIEIERERGVILEEIAEYEDTPADYCAERMTHALFGGAALGRPVIGFRETVSAFDEGTARSYWSRASDVGGAILSIAGGFDPGKIESLAERAARRFPASAGAAKYSDAHSTGEASPLQFDERPIEQVQLCIGFRGIRRNDARRIPLLLLDAVLGGGMGSRLFNEVRERRGLAYSVGTSVASHAEGGYVMIYASTTPEKLDEALEVCKAEARRIAREPVLADELVTAARMQQRLFLLHADHPTARCARNTLRSVYGEEFHSDREVIDRILGTTEEDVLELAAAVFEPWQPVLSLVGPIAEADARRAFEKLLS